MAHEGYHEPYEELSEDARDFHRMIESIIEEFEAVDWYHQRAEVTKDKDAKAIFEHNRDEEMEHACMGLEWLRRRNPTFDSMLRTYLFSDKDILEVEDESTSGEGTASKSGSLSLGKIK